MVPHVTASYVERSAGNPDFIYLEDQVKLAREASAITKLPLNEAARIALRDEQEQKALMIENKRRKAKGEELLTSLDEDEEEADDTAGEEDGSGDEVAADDSVEDDTPDVLLTEAGNVLVDALLLKQRAYAVHTPATEKKSEQ